MAANFRPAASELSKSAQITPAYEASDLRSGPLDEQICENVLSENAPIEDNLTNQKQKIEDLGLGKDSSAADWLVELDQYVVADEDSDEHK